VSHSDTLFRRLELVAPALLRAGGRVAESPRLAELYPRYLQVSHAIVRASVPLMTAACQALRVRAHDGLTDPLLGYFTAHIAEEQGHDALLLDDLAELGIDPAETLGFMPPRRVAEVVGAQYYWIFHHHPVALLGYIAVLEGFPPTLGLIDAMIDRSGLPAAAFRTLLLHAEADPGHRQELRGLLDALPLTGAELSVVSLSALATVDGLVEVFDDLVDTAPRELERASPSGRRSSI
jgi:hypothetical protein